MTFELFIVEHPFSVESFLTNSPIEQLEGLTGLGEIGIHPGEIQDILSEGTSNPGSPGQNEFQVPYRLGF